MVSTKRFLFYLKVIIKYKKKKERETKYSGKIKKILISKLKSNESIH